MVVVGGGPSLTPEQLGEVRCARDAAGPARLRVIAVNDAYRLAPWADLLFFADSKWWGWHKDRPEFKDYKGERCSVFPNGGEIADPEVHLLRYDSAEGLSTDPQYLRTGSNSAYMSVNVAVLAGATRVVLIGVDAKPGAKKQSHWFGDHPDRTKPPYRHMVQAFREMKPLLDKAGVEVINASPGSAVTAFPQMELGEALASVLRDPAPAALPA